jgi:hypothetical protein
MLRFIAYEAIPDLNLQPVSIGWSSTLSITNISILRGLAPLFIIEHTKFRFSILIKPI